MSAPPPLLKKPKIEEQEQEENGVNAAEEEEAEEEKSNGVTEELARSEQEEALVALLEHRTKEVEHLRQRITYYKKQLNEAERRLEDTQSRLARLRGQDNLVTPKSSVGKHNEVVKIEKRSTSPVQPNEGSLKPPNDSSRKETLPRPQLVIPGVTPNISQQPKVEESGTKSSSNSGSLSSSSKPSNSIVKQKGERSHITSSEQDARETQHKGVKRKLEQKEHKDLIPLINSSSSARMIRCQTGCLLSSQHKRKLRSLISCPTNDQLFVTSALDGVINLWQVQGRGSSASLLSSTDCQSAKQRRWPEDIAWHPQGNSIFAAYSADGGDSQISILNLNKGKERARVSFLEAKPHVKGIINSIIFTPWDDTCFVTGGSDHAVVLWTQKDEESSWTPKALHRSMHSSAVMGVAGMQHKKLVVSAGADKRIIGFDIMSGRADYKHQIESKCMSVLPNPCDFNLFMVQTGTPERQIRLFDIRVRQMEIHSFGWKQESSESQSALINQCWSPDGLYITSGSADPVIHIFDIRYNAHKPTQSIRAHQKRVFKAFYVPGDEPYVLLDERNVGPRYQNPAS